MTAFHDLYQRHYQDIYRFALFLTGDHAQAEDLTADTFVRAWVARDRINQVTVRGYLLTIARNLYRDQLRRARPMTALPDSMPDPGPGVEARVHDRIALEHVRGRLQHVATADRRALLLFIVRGMSYREIARALGISVSAVKSRIRRAREGIAEGSHRQNCSGEST